jgi:hypothetical protein
MNPNLHEPKYTFLITSRSVLLRMRNDSDKSCRENQHTHFVFSNSFLENRTVYEITWKNMVQPETPQTSIYCGACTLHAVKLRIQTRTQNMYYLLPFHCNNGYGNAPQCYVYTHISSLDNNDIVLYNLIYI